MGNSNSQSYDLTQAESAARDKRRKSDEESVLDTSPCTGLSMTAKQSMRKPMKKRDKENMERPESASSEEQIEKAADTESPTETVTVRQRDIDSEPLDEHVEPKETVPYTPVTQKKAEPTATPASKKKSVKIAVEEQQHSPVPRDPVSAINESMDAPVCITESMLMESSYEVLTRHPEVEKMDLESANTGTPSPAMKPRAMLPPSYEEAKQHSAPSAPSPAAQPIVEESHEILCRHPEVEKMELTAGGSSAYNAYDTVPDEKAAPRTEDEQMVAVVFGTPEVPKKQEERGLGRQATVESAPMEETADSEWDEDTQELVRDEGNLMDGTEYPVPVMHVLAPVPSLGMVPLEAVPSQSSYERQK